MATSDEPSELLIAGFVPSHLFVPADVLRVIFMFYSFHDLHINLYLILKCNQYITMINVHNDKILQNKFNLMSNNNNNVSRSYSNLKAIDCHTLPIPLISYLSNDKDVNYSSQWSIFLQLQTINYCRSMCINAINTRNKESSLDVYNFQLPPCSNKLPIYDKRRNKLYDIQNEFMNNIYSLDFNQDTNYDNWEWKKISINIKYQRYGTSSCMIDNDRFIAILGGQSPISGIPLSRFELYAINCDKVITLKESLQSRSNAICLYHDRFHKVIYGGGHRDNQETFRGIEWYDINKNIWIQIAELQRILNINDIWISSINPNLLFVASIDDNHDINIHKMDLRDKYLHQMSRAIWIYTYSDLLGVDEYGNIAHILL